MHTTKIEWGLIPGEEDILRSYLAQTLEFQDSLHYSALARLIGAVSEESCHLRWTQAIKRLEDGTSSTGTDDMLLFGGVLDQMQHWDREVDLEKLSLSIPGGRSETTVRLGLESLKAKLAGALEENKPARQGPGDSLAASNALRGMDSMESMNADGGAGAPDAVRGLAGNTEAGGQSKSIFAPSQTGDCIIPVMTVDDSSPSAADYRRDNAQAGKTHGRVPAQRESHRDVGMGEPYETLRAADKQVWHNTSPDSTMAEWDDDEDSLTQLSTSFTPWQDKGKKRAREEDTDVEESRPTKVIIASGIEHAAVDGEAVTAGDDSAKATTEAAQEQTYPSATEVRAMRKLVPVEDLGSDWSAEEEDDEWYAMYQTADTAGPAEEPAAGAANDLLMQDGTIAEQKPGKLKISIKLKGGSAGRKRLAGMTASPAVNGKRDGDADADYTPVQYHKKEAPMQEMPATTQFRLVAENTRSSSARLKKAVAVMETVEAEVEAVRKAGGAVVKKEDDAYKEATAPQKAAAAPRKAVSGTKTTAAVPKKHSTTHKRVPRSTARTNHLSKSVAQPRTLLSVAATPSTSSSKDPISKNPAVEAIMRQDPIRMTMGELVAAAAKAGQMALEATEHHKRILAAVEFARETLEKGGWMGERGRDDRDENGMDEEGGSARDVFLVPASFKVV